MPINVCLKLNKQNHHIWNEGIRKKAKRNWLLVSMNSCGCIYAFCHYHFPPNVLQCKIRPNETVITVWLLLGRQQSIRHPEIFCFWIFQSKFTHFTPFTENIGAAFSKYAHTVRETEIIESNGLKMQNESKWGGKRENIYIYAYKSVAREPINRHHQVYRDMSVLFTNFIRYMQLFACLLAYLLAGWLFPHTHEHTVCILRSHFEKCNNSLALSKGYNAHTWNTRLCVRVCACERAVRVRSIFTVQYILFTENPTKRMKWICKFMYISVVFSAFFFIRS